jgi:thymidylate synthase (FAD)
MLPMPKASKLLENVSFQKNAYLLDPELLDEIRAFLEYKTQISEPRNVLNHGFVRLVDYMGNDLSIVRAARVSYNADWRSGEDEGKDARLIDYLLRNRHTSPFECVVFTFEIKCPFFVARQWHRHRTWSYNEVSARYTELPEEFYIPALEQITTQSKDNKQMRTDKQHPMADEFIKHMRAHGTKCFTFYQDLLKWGCPRELARSVLPMGTYTRFFGTVNLHNLFHFLDLRLGSHAQYEIRVYAEAILDIIHNIVPIASNTWMDLRAKANG